MNIFSLAPSSPSQGFELFSTAPAAEQAARSNQFAACLTRQGLTGACAADESQAGPGAAGRKRTLDAAREILNSAREEFGLSAPSETPAQAGKSGPLKTAAAFAGLEAASMGKKTRTSAAAKVTDRLNPRQVKITAQDFAAMRQGLLDSGLSEKAVKELEEKALSHAGLTWGEFVQAVTSRTGTAGAADKTQSMSALDRQNLGGLFAKLGFTPQESEGLVKDLSEKRFTGVMTQVAGKIAAKNADTYLPITPQEIATLASALNLSKDGVAKLAGYTARSASLSLDEAKAALSQAGQSLVADATQRKASDTRLMALVGQTFKSAMQTENDRRQSERLGGEPQERRMRDGKGIGREIRKSFEGGADSTGQVAKDSPLIGAPGSKSRDDKGLLSQTTASTSPQAKDGKGQGTAETGQDSRQSGREPSGKSQATDADKSWKEFLSRLRLDESDAHPSQGQGQATSTVNLTATAPQATAQAPGQAPGQAAASGPGFMRQIQDAVLKDLGQGTKQLTVQLEPENLGPVNVTLQLKGKEVQAVISSDNTDTVALIQDRMDSIRQTLEDQGLKVAKLEVRSSLADSQQFTHWSGAENHNQAQEQEARSQWLGRMRSMRPDDDFLAQDMQTVAMGANNAQSGLHIIA
jgi:flagellar hook-length control protein FliK